MGLLLQGPQDWNNLRNSSEWPMCSDSLAPGPSADTADHASHRGSPAYIKVSAWGQASNWTHTSWSLLEHTPGTKGQCHPCMLPLPDFRAPVSPEQVLIHISGTPIFVAATQGTPLGCLTPEARETCIPGPFGSVQSLSHVWIFATPWTATHQASLSFINSWRLLKLIPIESVMPSNHLILCHPLLPLPSLLWVSFLHQVAKVLELQL